MNKEKFDLPREYDSIAAAEAAGVDYGVVFTVGGKLYSFDKSAPVTVDAAELVRRGFGDVPPYEVGIPGLTPSRLSTAPTRLR